MVRFFAIVVVSMFVLITSIPAQAQVPPAGWAEFETKDAMITRLEAIPTQVGWIFEAAFQPCNADPNRIGITVWSIDGNNRIQGLLSTQPDAGSVGLGWHPREDVLTSNIYSYSAGNPAAILDFGNNTAFAFKLGHGVAGITKNGDFITITPERPRVATGVDVIAYPGKRGVRADFIAYALDAEGKLVNFDTPAQFASGIREQSTASRDITISATYNSGKTAYVDLSKPWEFLGLAKAGSSMVRFVDPEIAGVELIPQTGTMALAPAIAEKQAIVTLHGNFGRLFCQGASQHAELNWIDRQGGCPNNLGGRCGNFWLMNGIAQCYTDISLIDQARTNDSVVVHQPQGADGFIRLKGVGPSPTWRVVVKNGNVTTVPQKVESLDSIARGILVLLVLLTSVLLCRRRN
jgi:hypothetical protein